MAPPVCGNIGNVPTEMEKIVVEKMMIFPKALFLATTFSKIVKKSIFPLNFYQKFSKISQNFTIRVFRPNARKINAWFCCARGFSGVKIRKI